MNPAWPTWFVELVRVYKFHYPPSDLARDPVVCWHTIPPHGYLWEPGAIVILGSRLPLPDNPPAEENASDAAEEPETASVEESGSVALAAATAEPTPIVERVFELIYEYRLSDLLREGYRVEPLGGNIAHFERRPTALLMRDVRAGSSSPLHALLDIEQWAEED